MALHWLVWSYPGLKVSTSAGSNTDRNLRIALNLGSSKLEAS